MFADQFIPDGYRTHILAVIQADGVGGANIGANKKENGVLGLTHSPFVTPASLSRW
jgi:hypothetical protein